VICRVVSVALALTFLAAGLPKLLAEPAEFAQTIRNYRFLPETLINWAAVTLPWLETLAGLALLTGVLRRSAALVTAVLAMVFMAALLSAMQRGLRIDCGCFGAAGSAGLVSGTHVALDLVLVLLSLFVLLHSENVAQPGDSIA
jgi:putative oxidoreductase